MSAPGRPSLRAAAPQVRATRLASPEDWRRIRPRLLALEEAAMPEAWAASGWQEALWELQRRPPAWLVEIGADPAAPDAALFLRARDRSTSLGRLRVLRSADWHAMRMAPWLVQPGREGEAARALLASGPALARATGAHLLRLFKLDAQSTAPLQAALEECRRPYRLLPMEPSPVIRLGKGFDGWLGGHGRKTLYNLRRGRRLLEKALGGPAELRRLRPRGDPASDPDPEVRGAWRAFQDLHGEKWRRIARTAPSSPPVEAIAAFTRATAAAWARRGWLEILTLGRGGRCASAQVQIRHPDRIWVAWMAYDASLSRFSPGRILLLDAIREAHAGGHRIVELGATGGHWKNTWCNGAEPVLRLEWPLGGWKGSLWGLGTLLRGRFGHRKREAA